MYSSLKYTQQLEAAGFTREQAETTVNLVLETMDQHFSTKADLKELEYSMKTMETGIRADMKEMESSIRADITRVERNLEHFSRETAHKFIQLESRMTLKLGAVMLGGIALLEFLR